MNFKEKVAAVVEAVRDHDEDEDGDGICWGYWWNEKENILENSGHGACHAYLDVDSCRKSNIVGSVIMPPRGGITEEQAQEFYEFLLDKDKSPYAALLEWLGEHLVVVRDGQKNIVGLVTTKNFNNRVRISFFKAFRDPCEHPQCTSSWLKYKDYNPSVAFGMSHFYHANGDKMLVDHSVIDSRDLERKFNLAQLVYPKKTKWEFDKYVGESYYGENKYLWSGTFNWREDIPKKGVKVRTPAQKAFFYNKYYDKDPVPGNYSPEELIEFLKNAKEYVKNA